MSAAFVPSRLLPSVLAIARRLQWGLSVGILAAAMAGCTTTGAMHDSASAVSTGIDTESEVYRLANTRLQLGAMHFQEGRNEIALNEVMRALQVYPEYVDAHSLQGWIYMAERDYLKADASFDRALRLRPGDPNTRYNQGWSQCQQKNFDMAQLHFDAALAASRFASEDRARTLLAKVVCLRQAGSKEDLLPLMAQAYELNPGNPSIALNYAQVLFDQDNAQKARFYVQRLNNSEGVSAASLWLGIKVERKLGDSVAVRQLAGQLVQRFPTSPEREKFEQGTFDE